MEFDFYISKALTADNESICKLKGTDLQSVGLISQQHRHTRFYGSEPSETKFHKIKKIVDAIGKASSKVSPNSLTGRLNLSHKQSLLTADLKALINDYT
jgi:hypothetical protein